MFAAFTEYMILARLFTFHPAVLTVVVFILVSPVGNNTFATMSAKTSLNYCRVTFPPGALHRSYQRILKGQKGTGWKRQIQLNHYDTNQARHVEDINATRLHEIDEIHPQKNCHLWIYCVNHQLDAREEVDFRAFHPTNHEFTLEISANNKTRVHDIRAILVSELNLETTKREEPTAGFATNVPLTDHTTQARSLNLQQPRTLETPEKVTLKWISEHVPVAMLWGALAALAAIVTGAFSLGRWSATIEPKLSEEPSTLSPTEPPISSASDSPAASE